MTTVLIANIGNRDVWVARDAPIPGDVHPAWNPDGSRRALGETLRRTWPEARDHLRLPIIAKALNYARQEAGGVDRVVLIASDQSGVDGVSEHHLAQDTCEMAPVVTRLLVERHGLDEAAIEHHLVHGNPADYPGMEAFFDELLPRLRNAHPEALFYLEVSGGTPAMTSMLLTVGAQVFGLQARPLYVSPQAEQPFPLDLGRRTVAESLQRVVREDVSIYAYHAAAETVRGDLELLRDFAPADGLLALLTYARQRVNFNFRQARAALDSVPPEERPAAVDALRRELRPDEGWWLLHEIVHNAELRLRVGDYGDFLVRLFRFDEAARRHTALELGARFEDWDGEPDPGGELVDPAWLGQRPDLEAYFEKKEVHRVKDGRARATRFVLDLLIAFLARQQGKEEPLQLLKRLGRVNQLSSVRNSSFTTHTFDGITARRMTAAFTGDPDAEGSDEELAAIMDAVKEACEMATGRTVASVNPYDRVNAAILELLEGGTEDQQSPSET